MGRAPDQTGQGRPHPGRRCQAARHLARLSAHCSTPGASQSEGLCAAARLRTAVPARSLRRKAAEEDVSRRRPRSAGECRALSSCPSCTARTPSVPSVLPPSRKSLLLSPQQGTGGKPYHGSWYLVLLLPSRFHHSRGDVERRGEFYTPAFECSFKRGVALKCLFTP